MALSSYFSLAIYLTFVQSVFAETRATVVFEWIEIDNAAWTKWIGDSKNAKAEDHDLRDFVQQLLDQGEASWVDMAIVSGADRQISSTESVSEITYPSELRGGAHLFEGSKTPSPPNAAAFETRNVGTTAQIDLVQIEPLRFRINLNPEIVRLTGDISMGKGASKIRQPIFYTMSASTSFEVGGQPRLIASNRPDKSIDDTRKAPVVLWFVRILAEELSDEE